MARFRSRIGSIETGCRGPSRGSSLGMPRHDFGTIPAVGRPSSIRPTLAIKFFPKSVPAIHRATLGGRDLVVAVYQDEFEPDGWARLEIWHDPSVGFLPRFARYSVWVPGRETCK